MIRTTVVRLGLLAICPLVSLTGLLGASVLGAAPHKAPDKAPPFPLSLFANAKAEDYIDEAACVRCHRKSHATFQPSPHLTFVSDATAPKDRQGCQSCHGPGAPHVQHLRDISERYQYVISYTRSTPQQASMACLRCHNDTMTLDHWRRTEHSRAGVSCSGCHTMHQDPHGRYPVDNTDRELRELRSRPPVFIAAPPPRKLLADDQPTLCGRCHPKVLNEFRQNFHHPVPEGRIVCSDCHEVHPRRDAVMHTAATTRLRPMSQVCVTCHGDVAGPFVYEHDPVVGLTGDGCIECHRAHGSANPALLTVFSRGVCNQCHADKANNHHPGRSCWDAGCHVAMHGSNTSPFFLSR